MKRWTWIVGLMAFAAATEGLALPIRNVALGAEVSLHGSFFVGGYPGGWTVDAATVVDGQYLAASTYWQHGAVWWHQPVGSDQHLVIDLAGEFQLSSLAVQADDNDSYELWYRKGAGSGWRLLWLIPSVNVYQGADLFGMQSRPDPHDPLRPYRLATPVVATQLMLRGGADSDTLYAVSEVQAFGRPIAAPAPWALLAAALLAGTGGAAARRRST